MGREGFEVEDASADERVQIELEDPSREWGLNKQWFVWPHGIRVKMSPY